MNKDSVKGTLIVAAALCIVCSILVSGSAVSLKPMQIENAKLDIKKNLLMASGLVESSATKEDVLEKFKSIETKVVNFETGEYVDMNPEDFDQLKAASNTSMNYQIPSNKDQAKIKLRAKMGKVYFVKDGGQIKLIVLPVRGKGLWSTLYGFLALSNDVQTIAGLGFYQHGETPGLGGEIDNPNWKKIWKGKTAFDSEFNPIIQVMKGAVEVTTPGADSKVDGLSGATITSYGVSELVKYWLGANAYGPFLKAFKMDKEI